MGDNHPRRRYADGTLTPPVIVAGVSPMIAGQVNFDAEISADAVTLWSNDGRFDAGGKLLDAQIAVAERRGDGFLRRSDSAALFASVNAGGLNFAPAIWRATRSGPDAAFDPPARVAAATGFVEGPALSADGRKLYYHKREAGVFRLYLLTR